jgi:hypothetical protein
LAKEDLPVTTACQPSKQGVVGGDIICEGGDPAVLAAVPAWAKPPKIVEVLNTNIDPDGYDRGIGYAARYEGPLSDIEPLYQSQVKGEPGIRLGSQNGSRMIVGTKVGNISGTYLSLRPIPKSGGGEFVEILFFHGMS